MMRSASSGTTRAKEPVLCLSAYALIFFSHSLNDVASISKSRSHQLSQVGLVAHHVLQLLPHHPYRRPLLRLLSRDFSIASAIM